MKELLGLKNFRRFAGFIFNLNISDVNVLGDERGDFYC